MIVYASNGGAIGDGVRITRVSNGGQTLEVLVDPKAMRWSEIVIKADDPNTAPVYPLTGDLNIEVPE